ncbi:MAG: hypothetical protein ACLFUS_13135 [Candidatus Sumerlaeia bacterium]
MTRNIFPVGAMLVILMLLIVGCGKESAEEAQEKEMEKMIEQQIRSQGGNADIDISKGKMSIQTEDGQAIQLQTNGALERPKDFPKDIYLPSKGKITRSLMGQGEFTVGYTIDMKPEKIMVEYEDRMTKDGWNKSATMTQGPMSMIEFEKDSRTANVVIQSAGDETSVMVTGDK